MSRAGGWTHPALAGAGGKAAIVLLPLGSVEAHGPHLPPETDTLIAEHLARAVAARIEGEMELPAPIAPAITGTSSSYADGFPGTVSMPARDAKRILKEEISSLYRSGARRIVLVNLHFDPVHMGSVRETAVEMAGDGAGAMLFPDFTRRHHAQRIGGEFATGSCHAGRFETSLMLAAAPDKVKDGYRTLPPLFVDLPAAIKDGKRGFKEIGMGQGYCGEPATATRGEGQSLFKTLADIVFEECVSAWRS